MNEPHAAKITRCSKASDVTNYSSPDGDQHRVAVRAREDQITGDCFHRGEALCGLLIVEKDRLLGAGKRPGEHAAPVSPNARRGKNENACRVAKALNQFRSLRNRTARAIEMYTDPLNF